MERHFNKNGILTYAVFSLVLIFWSSCSTYYQKNEDLMNAVYTHNYEAANNLLKDDAKWEKQERNKLLFYLNKGTVLWMQGDYKNSISYFGKADFFVEDYNKNVGDAVLTMLVNAKLSTYGGENFEQILIHYYGALNYVALNQPDEALIEGKRMLEKMQKITDKYKSENKYKRDAFAHNLLGIIYEMKGEYNDAYIAYKNAYEVYKNDYLPQLGTPVPTQLKKDLLRMAKTNGFYDEMRTFESEFGLKAENVIKDKGEVLVFWNNGLGPIKAERSINISIIPMGNGYVQFVNWDLGISIPFKVDDDNQKADLLDMKFIRMALPKYVSRDLYYTSAQLVNGGQKVNFQVIEDVNAIAFKSLSDRMGRELAIGLARVALKQLAVHRAQKNKENAGLAAAALIYGAVSEQADTRNWQLLPSAINYARISVDEGKQTIKFEALNNQNSKVETKNFELDVQKGKLKIVSFQTIDFSGYGNQ